MTLGELWKIKKQKCAYFESYYNMAELVILFMSYIAIALYFLKTLLTNNAMAEFNR